MISAERGEHWSNGRIRSSVSRGPEFESIMTIEKEITLHCLNAPSCL